MILLDGLEVFNISASSFFFIRRRFHQGCRSRPFWPEPLFWSGSYFHSTVNILFLRDPKYDHDHDQW